MKVKFSSLQEKRLVMERKQSLKHTGIYINHDLTKQEKSRKQREAKKVAIQTNLERQGCDERQQESVHCHWFAHPSVSIIK